MEDERKGTNTNSREEGPERTRSGTKKAKEKPPLRLVEDDTKPLLRDPIVRSSPMETEQILLRLPPFPQFRN